ncbi:hypothetical protein CORC01_05745 [Colletotrichum orchidophilum]|uniref:Uncharacterized protein n=1 Tax=Colletotrichum orchidophilum TaxID=1209926 RepID=A0A1G4BCJ1_9PEZI|nr:uncharacterized protein CORC01_05745 [Colletotrichum orchidophilum]OHE99055.1 hypothetical protein CORC01_05745 [Colletotrichum orchidophilum]
MPTVIQTHDEVDLVQISISDTNKHTIVTCQNGFVYMILRAEQQHLHLDLRPENIWLTVLAQFSFFPSGGCSRVSIARPLVGHNGQYDLVIFVKGRSNIDNIDVAF